MKFKDLKQILLQRDIEMIGEGVIRHYALFLPLVEVDDEWCLLFERRSKYVSQSFDISFPGGRVEKDEDYQDAAIRETMEELLVTKDQIEVLGPIDLYLAHDFAIVHSYIGILHDYEMTFYNQEVDSILCIPLKKLLNHKPEVYAGKLLLQLEDDFPYSRIQGGRNYPWRPASRKILFYNIDDVTIWGMTAQILQNALVFLKKSV